MLFTIWRFPIFNWILVLIGSLCLLILFSRKADAQAFSLSIDPPLTYIRALPPTKVETPIQITNQQDVPLTLTVSPKPFTENGEFGEVSLLDQPLPIESLIQILDEDKPIKDIKLSPNESRELVLFIDLPNNTPPQDYYFSLIFQAKHNLMPRTAKEEEVVTAFSQLVPAVATNVLLSIGPWEKSNLTAKFITRSFYEAGPVDFNLRVTNNSKNVEFIQGEVLISNLFGQTVGKIDLPSQYALAKTSRTYNKIFWPETFLVGPYTAVLSLGPGKKTTEIATFFAFPYRAVALAATILWISGWIIIRAKQRINSSYPINPN